QHHDAAELFPDLRRAAGAGAGFHRRHHAGPVRAGPAGGARQSAARAGGGHPALRGAADGIRAVGRHHRAGRGAYADLNRFVGPGMLSWHMSGEIMVFVILGGVGRLMGPVAGAMAFILLEHVLGGWTEYWQAPLGFLLLAIVL